MIYATVALAAVAAAVAAQGGLPLASGNYSGLEKITRATTRHELKQPARTWKPGYGKVIEATPRAHGIQPGPCGMPIIAADPSVDPKFVIPTPGSETRETKIETVEPPPCGPFTVAPAKQPQASRKR